MSSGDVFEQVRTGALSPREGAELLAQKRDAGRRPSKPRWMPRPVYLLGLMVLTLVIPKLAGRFSV